MNALVLGGTVFVGRSLVDHLLHAGTTVTVLNRGRTADDLPAEVRRIVADRTDVDSMRAALRGTTWDAVFDVSGFVMAAAGGDIQDLLELVDGNVGAYVYVSSIMAYDQSMVGVMPWTEDLPSDTGGTASYGGFKALTEAAMLDRFTRTGFPVAIVRPAAIYGPRNNIYDMETPMFLRLLQQRPILLPHSGLVTASYGHVDDLCAAMLAVASCIAARGRVLNITAEAVTTRRYIHTLAAVVGVEPVIVDVADHLVGQLPAGVFGHLFGARHHAVLSTDAVRQVAGILPTFNLADGHAHTYEWFLAQGFDQLTEPLVDPVWRATWDFAVEDRAMELLR